MCPASLLSDAALSCRIRRQVDEWPLESWCELLCDDLTSPQWEVRHGAVTALRETLKIHGSGAGRRPGLTEAQVSRPTPDGWTAPRLSATSPVEMWRHLKR